MRSIRRKDIGDTSSANNFLSFLEDTLSKLKNKVVRLIRLDSGFFQSDIMDYNDKLVLKIALNKKRRAWFSRLWNYSKAFEYPFIFSNA
jgi:hypothetical protein